MLGSSDSAAVVLVVLLGGVLSSELVGLGVAELLKVGLGEASATPVERPGGGSSRSRSCPQALKVPAKARMDKPAIRRDSAGEGLKVRRDKAGTRKVTIFLAGV